MSHYQNEIQKIQQDIEQVQEKLNNFKRNDVLSQEAQAEYDQMAQFEQDANS